VLQDFAIGDRLKFDSENKLSISSERVSLRGRRLEGAVLVGAHLRKADFTGAQLAGAQLTDADLREAKFTCESHEPLTCTQLQGADLSGAQLQAASLDGACLQGAFLQMTELQGTDLDGAHLEGADLTYAHLQGADLNNAHLEGALLRGAQLQAASLYSAHLQGASLHGAKLKGAVLSYAELEAASFKYAQLQGADLDGAQWQGADLTEAELQTAFLRNVFVRRTYPPTKEYSKSALIEEPTPESKYRGLDCRGAASKVCDWKDTSYAVLRASIEAAPVNLVLGPTRAEALKRVERLNINSQQDDALIVEGWHDLAEESQRSAETYPQGLAKLLIRIGCAAEEGYVIDGLIHSLDVRFGDNTVQKAEVADAFLKEENCPSARGLSE
jgi:uncharacterized protein YjbI with pentapeptide repeats